ncbi:MAG: branched-chain amino acid transaminase [Myxococcota bacterium]
MSGPRLWKNGALVDRDDARVDLLSHGLHYGTGVFEGIRCYDTGKGPAIFQLEAHMDRFARGAEVLGMDLDMAALTQGVVDTVAASGFGDAYIRPLAFYASGGLGLDTAPLTAEVAVGVMPWTSHLGEASKAGIRVHLSSYRRNPHRSLPPLKLCGGYVNSVLAKREATRLGCDEALFVDDAGRVCEATGENVFMVTGNDVVAVAHPDALPGITRSTVMALAGATEREVTLAELLQADEIFLTGTSAEVVPVSELSGRIFSKSTVTRDLQVAYDDLVHGRDKSRRTWLTAA